MPAPSPPSPVQQLKLNTAYDSNGIGNLGNEDITLSDTTLAVSVLNTLDGNTSGTVNANTVTTLTGSASDLITAYDSNGISNLGNEDATLSDTTLAASVLNTLDGHTSGTVNANTVTTLTGASDLITAYDSNGITGLGDEAVNVSSGTASTSQANTLAAATSGVVTATLSDGDLSTLAGLTETGNAYSITITDTSVDAAALNTLDGKTTVAVNATNITTLTGAAADLNTAYAANGSSITGLGNEASPSATPPSRLRPQHPRRQHLRHRRRQHRQHTHRQLQQISTPPTTQTASAISIMRPSLLSDTTLAVSVLNTLDGHTSGTINANTVTTLTGCCR